MIGLLLPTLTIFGIQLICAFPSPFTIPGINVDFKEILSKRELCPSSHYDDLDKYFYHAETQRCFKMRTVGPCGRNMIFMPHDDSDDNTFGICVCNNAGSTRYLEYHEETKSCHLIYTKAWCRSSSEWLSPNPYDENTLSCSHNPCAFRFRSDDDPREFVPFRSRCVPLGQPNPNCNQDEFVGFEKDNLYPTCVSKYQSYALGSLQGSRCPSGQVRTYNGKCTKSSTNNW